jgi:hypothetical protein
VVTVNCIEIVLFLFFVLFFAGNLVTARLKRFSNGINNAWCVTTEGSGLKGRFSPRLQCGTRLRECCITDIKSQCFYCVTALVKRLNYVASSVSAKKAFAIFLFLQPVFLNILQVFVK